MNTVAQIATATTRDTGPLVALLDAGGDEPNRGDAGRDDKRSRDHDKDRDPADDPRQKYPNHPSHQPTGSYQHPSTSLRKPVSFTSAAFQKAFGIANKNYSAMAEIVQNDPYLGHPTSLDLYKQLAHDYLQHGDDAGAFRFVQLQKLVEMQKDEPRTKLEPIIKEQQRAIARLDGFVQAEFKRMKNQRQRVQPRRTNLSAPTMSVTVEPVGLGEDPENPSLTNRVTVNIRAALPDDFRKVSSSDIQQLSDLARKCGFADSSPVYENARNQQGGTKIGPLNVPRYTPQNFPMDTLGKQDSTSIAATHPDRHEHPPQGLSAARGLDPGRHDLPRTLAMQRTISAERHGGNG
ncbi:hypothetical protein OHC33_006504 [Knufia fluminis]|uniref:Uncharacterized protein n=1 Tax=Knufia fluminis TaxID=191047 RepID=A0AAN8I6Y7_9EURO|nr:hypothetical protein OHC33_006504 [Knufia fluminis]